MSIPRAKGKAHAADLAYKLVLLARAEAIRKHGELKPGPVRWERLIGEEYREVCDELAVLDIPVLRGEQRDDEDRAITELSHLAQLCMGAMELILRGKTQEEV